jgi:hypothetical protein
MSSIIAYENNIGSCYYHQQDYTEALIHHTRAIELRKRYSNENDPSLTNT